VDEAVSKHFNTTGCFTSAQPVRTVLTTPNQDLVRPILIPQLRRIAFPRLEFDRDLGVVEQVGALEDDAKTALADLLADAVVHADDVAAAGGHLGRRGGTGRCWLVDDRQREVICSGNAGGERGSRESVEVVCVMGSRRCTWRACWRVLLCSGMDG